MVTKKELTQRVDEVTRWYCDICGKETTCGNSKHTCKMCRCDVCSGCSHVVEEYWHYCPVCWEIGKEFHKILDELQSSYDRNVEITIGAWKSAVLMKKARGG